MQVERWETLGSVLCYRREQQKRDFQTDKKKKGKKKVPPVQVYDQKIPRLSRKLGKWLRQGLWRDLSMLSPHPPTHTQTLDLSLESDVDIISFFVVFFKNGD